MERRCHNRRPRLAYVQQVLVSTLRPGDVIVMDNLDSHKRRAVGGVHYALYADARSPWPATTRVVAFDRASISASRPRNGVSPRAALNLPSGARAGGPQQAPVRCCCIAIAARQARSA